METPMTTNRWTCLYPGDWVNTAGHTINFTIKLPHWVWTAKTADGVVVGEFRTIREAKKAIKEAS